MRKNLYIGNPLALKKLESVENKSKYVTDLILRDIQQEKGEVVRKNEVLQIIQNYLKNNQVEDKTITSLRNLAQKNVPSNDGTQET